PDFRKISSNPPKAGYPKLIQKENDEKFGHCSGLRELSCGTIACKNLVPQDGA
ncbi:hypothetical protein Tco_1498079, partial [Tanacetum coccineum]